MTKPDWDVLVVGGGVAGSSTAVSCARRGWRVLLCEAGLPSHRRLAGELLHPPAVTGLASLGMGGALDELNPASVYGFLIADPTKQRETLLPYAEVMGLRPTGVAVEHAALTRAMLDCASTHSRVTTWLGARVREVEDRGNHCHAEVLIDGQLQSVTARVVILADGRGSSLRHKQGIEVRRDAKSRMMGWIARDVALPYPGFGHVYSCGEGLALAYAISSNEVRVMIECSPSPNLFESTSSSNTPDVAPIVELLPEPLRGALRASISNDKQQSAVIYGQWPKSVTKGRVGVVGDAGGCAHPLTASGLSFCVRDALSVAEALDEAGLSNPEEGLRRYARRRRRAMRTRQMLETAMVDALRGQDAVGRAIRGGLFRYWATSSSGRRASMGLLSTQAQDPLVMAREYARVCGHALLDDGRDVAVVEVLKTLAQRALDKRAFGARVRSPRPLWTSEQTRA